MTENILVTILVVFSLVTPIVILLTYYAAFQYGYEEGFQNRPKKMIPKKKPKPSHKTHPVYVPSKDKLKQMSKDFDSYYDWN